jgi:hypothetical protein
MAYTVRLHPTQVIQYLSRLEMPREVRIRGFTMLHNDLAAYGDTYRQDALRRLFPGASYFRYEIALLHGGHGYTFHFIVSNASAAFGVLLVADAERLV